MDRDQQGSRDGRCPSRGAACCSSGQRASAPRGGSQGSFAHHGALDAKIGQGAYLTHKMQYEKQSVPRSLRPQGV